MFRIPRVSTSLVAYFYSVLMELVFYRKHFRHLLFQSSHLVHLFRGMWKPWHPHYQWSVGPRCCTEFLQIYTAGLPLEIEMVLSRHSPTIRRCTKSCQTEDLRVPQFLTGGELKIISLKITFHCVGKGRSQMTIHSQKSLNSLWMMVLHHLSSCRSIYAMK